MFEALFRRKKESSLADENGEEKEYTQYAKEVERTLSILEAHLHTSDDPEEIAMMAMKTACNFYQADWAGLLEIDMDLGIWTPFWWYNTSMNDRTAILLNEFESSIVLRCYKTI